MRMKEGLWWVEQCAKELLMYIYATIISKDINPDFVHDAYGAGG